MSLYNMKENNISSDWENEFSSFSSLLLDYIDRGYCNLYEKKYNDDVVSKNYFRSENLYHDKYLRLSNHDLLMNKESTFSFLYCDKYLIDLKFLDILEDYVKRKGPISSVMLKELIERMSNLRDENINDQFDEFISDHMPLINEVTSKLLNSSIHNTTFKKSFKRVTYSKEVNKLRANQRILYKEIKDDIKNVASRCVNKTNKDGLLTKRQAQVLFLWLVRDLINFTIPFRFKRCGLNVVSFSETRACVQAECDISSFTMSELETVLREETSEMKIFQNQL